MTQIVQAAGLGLCAALMLALPQSADSSPRKTPKMTVLCLPPGGSKTIPCGMATRGTKLSLRMTQDGGPAPHTLIFREVGSGRTVPVKLQPKWISDHGMIPLPAGLCAGASSAARGGQQLQFEIQVLTSDLQNAQHADSVGFFQMRCN